MAEGNEQITTEEGWLKRILRRFIGDDLFREVFIDSCAGALNLGLAILNGWFGFSNHSAWSQTMSFYFLVLSAVTVYVAACIGKPEGRSARSVIRRCGICIMVLGVALAVFMFLSVIGREVICFSAGIGWILTVINLTCVGLAIWFAYQYRNADWVRRAFQRVSLAGALGSLLMLEVQTVGTYGQGWDMTVVNAVETVSTVVIVSLLVVLGKSLIKKANEIEDVTH